MKEIIYQFVTELMDFKPRVWRRIQISSKLNIEDLMDVMMVIFEFISVIFTVLLSSFGIGKFEWLSPLPVTIAE